MLKSILWCLLALSLTSCSYFQVHKQTIEQGNVIPENAVARLHTGMSVKQVTAIMGQPILVDLFTPHTLNYVYTIKQGATAMQETRITCQFVNGRLRRIIS